MIIFNSKMPEIDIYNLCNKIKIIHLLKIILITINSGFKKIFNQNSIMKEIVMKLNQKNMTLDHNLKKDQENLIIINKINNKFNI